MWLKFLLGGLIVAFCAFIGHFAAGKYRARKRFYADFSAFNARYLTELRYARRPLSALEGEKEGDFGKMLDAFSKTRTPAAALTFLTPAEREEAARYLSMLGRGDSASQSGFFSAQSPALEEKKRETEREARERSALYLKLGILAGLAFVILII